MVTGALNPNNNHRALQDRSLFLYTDLSLRVYVKNIYRDLKQTMIRSTNSLRQLCVILKPKSSLNVEFCLLMSADANILNAWTKTNSSLQIIPVEFQLQTVM